MPFSDGIQGTNAIKKADLIGIVKAYVPYKETAISLQTRMPRIEFQENSGLTAVEPVDTILETIDIAEKRIKQRQQRAKRKPQK